METQSRSIKMASVSSESHTVSGGAFSLRSSAIERGAFREVMQVEYLLIDIEADFF